MAKMYLIAQWFTVKAGGLIDYGRLQRLCYFTQAWSLAINDRPIMNEKFEAWANGPVCAKLDRALRNVMYRHIETDDFWSLTDKGDLSPKDTELLERVWLTYGGYNKRDMNILIQSEMPWLTARGTTPKDNLKGSVIKNRVIKDYYKLSCDLEQLEG